MMQCFKQILIVALLLPVTGCKKLLEVPLPGTETFQPSVFESDVTATAAIAGIYGNMIYSKGFAGGYTRSVTFLAGLSADELENYSSLAIPREFYGNTISTANEAIEKALWNEAYQYIYAANAVLEGLKPAIAITPATKQQLQGEALFTRAFCHFYLVNLFGDVPYLTTTDYRVNIVMSRTPKATVYQQLIADLKEAESLLTDAYPTIERVRPNKWAATALLARVYLYIKDWANAAAAATSVINHSSRYSLDTLQQVFLKNSREAIWQLMPNSPGINTQEGSNFILTAAPTSGEANAATLSPRLLQAFENGDQRRANWVDSVVVDSTVYYFPYKYKIKSGDEPTEYSMVLRLAEQYLIRAEAYAQRDNYAAARADVNVIRKRAGLPGITANTPTALLAAIAHERQVELFTEWGHRWLDLKRTDQANAVLGPIKAPGWQANAALYPIPRNQIAMDANLKQNPGYQ